MRYSLRTLLIVMLLGGPALAGFYHWPLAYFVAMYFATLASLAAGVGWLGWTEQAWWATHPSAAQIALRFSLVGLLTLGFVAMVFMFLY